MLSTLEATMTIGRVKAKQINIRLTPEQERAMKPYCVRTGMTTQAAVIDALTRAIADFAAPDDPDKSTAIGQ